MVDRAAARASALTPARTKGKEIAIGAAVAVATVAAAGVAAEAFAAEAVEAAGAAGAATEAVEATEAAGAAESAGTRSAFEHGYRYLPRIRQRVLEDPRAHNFPYSFDDEILAENPTTQKDASLLFRKVKKMNGKSGNYEIAVNPETRIIFHHNFKPFGKSGR